LGGRRRRALIRPPSRDELPAIAAFVATRQARPESRIAYFGDSPAEVAALLESWDDPWWEGARVFERGEGIAGFAAAEVDERQGRAWIHGPFVGDRQVTSVADELLDALISSLPAAVDDLELLGDVANVRLGELATRFGFTAGTVNHLLTLDAAGIRRLPALDAPPLEPRLTAAFVDLHDSVFPGTYYPGETLVDRFASGESVVVAVAERGSLVAYAAGQIDENGRGYVDFVAAAPDHRRRGHGRLVTVALVRALDARGPVPAVRLTVASTNDAALDLYHSLGFTRASSMVGYRRRPPTPA
jgi:ribosomal protein S18 acetylase RimI-like enzyme